MAYKAGLAKSGAGAILSIGPVVGTSSPTFTPIYNASAAPFSGQDQAVEKRQNFQSTFVEKLKVGVPDSGQLEITIDVVDSDPGQIALLAASQSQQPYMFEVQLLPGGGQTATGTLYAFGALVMPYQPEIDETKTVTAKVKLEITTLIVETVGS